MITVPQKQFTRALALASGVTERRHTIPVMSAVLMKANGSLELVGSDLDTQITATLPITSDKNAELLLPHTHELLRAFRTAGADELSFEVKDKGFRATGGALDCNVDVQGMVADDFPSAPTIVDTVFTATLSAEALRQIGRLMSAISTEETRYYLNGVYMHRVGGDEGWIWRFAATDGRRLLRLDLPLPDANGELPDNFIIPRRFLQRALTDLGNAEGPITLNVGYSSTPNSETTTAPERRGIPRLTIEAQLGDVTLKLQGRTIDGTYPDYSRVVPQSWAARAIFDRAELSRAILAVAGRPGKKVRCVKLAFEKGACVIECAQAVTGITNVWRIDCQHDVPAGRFMGLNAQYLLDMLDALGGDEVACELMPPPGDAMIEINPITWRNPADGNILGIQMPMRV